MQKLNDKLKVGGLLKWLCFELIISVLFIQNVCYKVVIYKLKHLALCILENDYIHDYMHKKVNIHLRFDYLLWLGMTLGIGGDFSIYNQI